jgi:hypothetical protein
VKDGGCRTSPRRRAARPASSSCSTTTRRTGSPGRARAFRPVRRGAKCIEKPVENRSVFMKIREIGLDWFYRFLIKW